MALNSMEAPRRNAGKITRLYRLISEIERARKTQESIGLDTSVLVGEINRMHFKISLLEKGVVPSTAKQRAYSRSDVIAITGPAPKTFDTEEHAVARHLFAAYVEAFRGAETWVQEHEKLPKDWYEMMALRKAAHAHCIQNGD